MKLPSGGEISSEVAPLRPASSVILVRDDGAVLFEARQPGMSFFGGAHVFPGGRVDPSDADPVLLERLGDIRQLLSRLTHWPGEPLQPLEALGFFVGAARELFEEAGVLLATGGDAAAHQALREHFVPSLLGLGLLPDLAALVPWAHWVTPSVEQKRYDTRFFLARLPKGQEAVLDAKESTSLVWLRPAAALAKAAQGEIVLPPPTIRNLEDMVPHGAGLFAYAEHRVIAPIQPKILTDPEIAILLPWDRDYAGAPGEGGRPGAHPMAEGPSRIVLQGKRWVSR